MSKRKALGRGLGALLPEISPGDKGQGPQTGFLEIGVERISAGSQQPRRSFTEEALTELTESIRIQGVLQPLLVRRTEAGYTIVAGERRFRAACRAGLKKVPVVIKEATEAEAFEMALVENLQRQDLNPVEEAEAFERLVEEYGLTQEQVASRVGMDRSTVANSLRLLKLPERVKASLREGSLTPGHARALLSMKDAKRMEAALRKIQKEELSVRQTEAFVRKEDKSEKQSPGPGPKTATPAVRQLEERLQRALGTRVRLKARGKDQGKLEIEYHSLDELDRLLDILLK